MSIFDPASTGAMAAGDVISSIGSAIDKAKVAYAHSKTSSLVQMTSVARVEPLAIVDPDCFISEAIPLHQVMQCAHNIFTAYYVQAISLLGNVGNINIVKTLDRLNPNRTADSSDFFTHMQKSMANESFYDRKFSGTDELFGLGQENFKLPNYALEAKNNQKKDDDLKKQEIKTGELKSVTELSNVSIGKLINVTLKDQEVELTIPIAIRLLVNELPASAMLRLLSLQGLDRTLTERYYKWRAGRIGFIKDLVLMQDLIREDKKAMMQDKSGILDEIMRRAKNNKLAGFFSKNASLNESANIVVFTEEIARQLKLQHNMDIDNFKQRQHIFDSSYSLLLIKMDREYERVTFYTNGMPLGSSMGKNELKSNAGKNSGTDLIEIFAALNKANQTSLF